MIVKIELLRFAFFCCILLLHCNLLIRGIDMQSRLCPRGAFAVEFFFIVSGALMARSALKFPKDGLIGRETLRYLGRKVARIWPKLLFAAVMIVIVDGVSGKCGFDGAVSSLLGSIGEICTVQIAGLNIALINGPTWYISAMLLGMLVLYPILIKNRDVFTGVVAPILIVFIYGWLLHFNRCMYADVGVWAGDFVNRCFIRALAGLSLGVEAFEVGRYISGLKLSKARVFALRCLEWGGMAIAFGWICLGAGTTRLYEFYLVFVLAGSLAVMFSNVGANLPKCLDRIVCYLGSLVLVMYINHRWIISLVKFLFPKCDTYRLYVTASMTALVGTIVFTVVYNYAMPRLAKLVFRHD